MSGAEKLRLRYPEYLSLEASGEAKHEYLGGEARAMAGGTPEHAALAAAVIVALSRLIGDRPCRLFSADLRVRVVESDLSTYPDVTVVCGPLERADDDDDAVTNPALIVEVLSPATEAWDRGGKFAHYRRIASLREYVLVSQAERRIEAFRREGDAWVLREAGPRESVELVSLDGQLEVDQVHRAPAAAP